MVEMPAGDEANIRVVLNWHAELAQLVPND